MLRTCTFCQRSTKIPLPNAEMKLQAKWLLDILKKYPVDIGFSIVNSFQLTERIGDVKLNRGKIMGSFDNVNMFPNISVDFTTKGLKRHLERNAKNTKFDGNLSNHRKNNH